MAKITLNPITGSYASVTAINARLQQIEDALNDNIIWRSGFVGEPNAMSVDLDMAGNRILNLGGSDIYPSGIVTTIQYGALADGSDDSAAIQAALDSGAPIVLHPAGYNSYVETSLTVNDDTTFIIDGTITRNFNLPGSHVSATIKNEDQTNGNSNIKILGKGRIESLAGMGGKNLAMWKVTDFELGGLTFGYCNGMCTALYLTHANIHDLIYDMGASAGLGEDGLHIFGGHDININNISGQTGDDLVAVTININFPTGPLTNVNINNVSGISNTASLIKIYNGNSDDANQYLQGINVKNVVGEAGHDTSSIISVNDTTLLNTIKDVCIDGVFATANSLQTAGGNGIVALYVDNITVRNATVLNSDGPNFRADYCNGVVFDNIVGLEATGTNKNSVSLTSCNDVDIRIKELKSAAQHGVYLGSCNRGSVYGGKILNCAANGITLTNSDYFNINGVYTNGNVAGITETGTSNYNKILGNNLTEAFPVVSIVGKNTILRDNDGFNIVTVQTTDATVTNLFTYTQAPDASVYRLRAEVIGTDSSNSKRASYVIEGLFYKASGTFTQQGSTTVVSSIESTASWDCDFAVAGGQVLVQVTGEAATTINWKGNVTIDRII